MKILPAIDLKDGMCVRLKKGDYETAHKVAEDVLTTAKGFLDAGATLIHMVDLDGAKDGSHANYNVVREVIEKTGAKVELGGGIRSMEDIDAVLALGVSRVIIGSAAVKNPELVKQAVDKYGDKIAVGIDALGRTVRTHGWLNDSGEDYIAFAKKMEDMVQGRKGRVGTYPSWWECGADQPCGEHRHREDQVKTDRGHFD